MGDFFSKGNTAHCLRWDDLWWGVYEIRPPSAYYTVDVNILSPVNPNEGSVEDDPYQSSKLSVSHVQPYANSENIRVQLVGDFATATKPPLFESKYLAVPKRPRDHKLVDADNPMKNAMLIDRHNFDFSGRTCNKIGVSYSAFKTGQTEKCYKPEGSCLHNQLDSYFTEDTERVNRSLSPLHNVASHCIGASHTIEDGLLLTCDWNTNRHTTMVRLEMKADDLRFITNVSPGEIVDATISNFAAKSREGKMNITVINVGSVTADYSVSITNCTAGLLPGPAGQISLSPLESKMVMIELETSSDTALNGACGATLQNSVGDVLVTKMVAFNVSKTAVVKGAQEGELADDGETGLYKREEAGTCAETCPDFFDYWCKNMYFMSIIH